MDNFITVRHANGTIAGVFPEGKVPSIYDTPLYEWDWATAEVTEQVAPENVVWVNSYGVFAR